MSRVRKSKTLWIETGLGDAVDRLTILRLKLDKVSLHGDVVKVRRAHGSLQTSIEAALGSSVTKVNRYFELIDVNSKLWDIEDRLRALDKAVFGFHSKNDNTDSLAVDEFLNLARSVYVLNDKRAALKREIDLEYASGITEVKIYMGGS